MQVEHRQVEDGHVLVVRGAVDAATSSELRDALAPLAAHGVWVDLAGVPFMDSSGLGALVGAHKRARRAGGTLVLVSPTPTVARVLELTRLDQVLRVALHGPPEPVR